MNLTNLRRSLGIRTKINLILIPALAPILIIAFIGYQMQRDSSLSKSSRMMQLVTQNFSQRINGFLENQTTVFHDWSKENVYGLAIEFETTRELGDQFEKMLQGAPGFGLLVLTDTEGKVLQACSNRGESVVREEEALGRTLEEALASFERDGRLVESPHGRSLARAAIRPSSTKRAPATPRANRTGSFSPISTGRRSRDSSTRRERSSGRAVSRTARSPCSTIERVERSLVPGQPRRRMFPTPPSVRI